MSAEVQFTFESGSKIAMATTWLEKNSAYYRGLKNWNQLPEKIQVELPNGNSLRVIQGTPQETIKKEDFNNATEFCNYYGINLSKLLKQEIRLFVDFLAGKPDDWNPAKEEQPPVMEAIAELAPHCDKLSLNVSHLLPVRARTWLFSQDFNQVRKVKLVGNAVISLMELKKFQNVESIHVKTNGLSPLAVTSKAFPKLKELTVECPQLTSTQALCGPNDTVRKLTLITEKPIQSLGLIHTWNGLEELQIKSVEGKAEETLEKLKEKKITVKIV